MKCSNATQLVIQDQRCNFQRLHAHRLQHFYEVFHYSFLWYLMIGGVAEREAQSGQLITNPASSRKREMGYLREIALRLIYTSHLVFCSSCLIWESPTNQPLADCRTTSSKKGTSSWFLPGALLCTQKTLYKMSITINWTMQSPNIVALICRLHIKDGSGFQT